MEIIFEDAGQKKFVSQDGDEMKIFFVFGGFKEMAHRAF